MMNLTQPWFSVEEVAKRVWKIDDNGEDTIYLIEGNEKALLIDTGWGFGNLPELVSTITSLPLIVVNTHGHPDHVCGDYQFEHVHIHYKDVLIMNGNFTREARTMMLDNIFKHKVMPGFSKEFWVNSQLNQVSTFSANRTFDLGGRILRAIEIPGHSPGSICLLEKNEGLLFTGDSVVEGEIWLHYEDCLPLSVYLNGLKELVKIEDDLKYVFPAHGKTPVTPGILSELNKGVVKIISGECRGYERKTFLGDGLQCKFDSCSVLYREDNL